MEALPARATDRSHPSPPSVPTAVGERAADVAAAGHQQRQPAAGGHQLQPDLPGWVDGHRLARRAAAVDERRPGLAERLGPPPGRAARAGAGRSCAASAPHPPSRCATAHCRRGHAHRAGQQRHLHLHSRRRRARGGGGGRAVGGRIPQAQARAASVAAPHPGARLLCPQCSPAPPLLTCGSWLDCNRQPLPAEVLQRRREEWIPARRVWGVASVPHPGWLAQEGSGLAHRLCKGTPQALALSNCPLGSDRWARKASKWPVQVASGPCTAPSIAPQACSDLCKRLQAAAGSLRPAWWRLTAPSSLQVLVGRPAQAPCATTGEPAVCLASLQVAQRARRCTGGVGCHREPPPPQAGWAQGGSARRECTQAAALADCADRPFALQCSLPHAGCPQRQGCPSDIQRAGPISTDHGARRRRGQEGAQPGRLGSSSDCGRHRQRAGVAG